MSKKKKKNTRKTNKIEKKNSTQKNLKENVQKEQMALVVVNQNRNLIANSSKEILKKVAKKLSLAVIGTLSIAYILGMIFVATSVFYVSHLQNGLIQRGVYVNGISISDLTTEQALNSINNQLNGTIPEYIILKYENEVYQLNLKELEIQFDTENAVQDAYDIGRTKNVVRDLMDYAEVVTNTVNIESELIYNDEKLNIYISSLSDQLPDKVQEFSYYIENDKLIINKGKNGVAINEEALKGTVLEHLKNRKYDEIEIPTFETLPKPINLQEIHDEIYIEPQNAYYVENPFEIHEQIIGKDFDIQNAQNIIDTNPDLEKYIITLNLTNPDIFVKDLNIFPDMLSTFSTNYVNNPNRTTNLRLAAEKINGTVLMPGETFSFNKIVGERTISAGYKNAAIFVNGQVEDGLAGGICQISSTLYDAVIGANLEVLERHNHSKLTSYLPGGKDATVVWGAYDFKFKNNREYPIKIDMSVENGKATANIYGIKSSEEYDITIEAYRAGVAGVYSVYNSYKVYKRDGIEVNREFLSRDLYK